MSFQSTLNSSLIAPLELPNGLAFIVDNNKSSGLQGQVLSSNNGDGLLWINGGGSGGGNVSTNTNNDFTASNSFTSSNLATTFTVSVPNVLFTTPVEFSDNIQPNSILDTNGDAGTSGQVLTAGTGGQVVWGVGGGSGGGNVSTNTANTFTETNTFNQNQMFSSVLNVNVPAIFGTNITVESSLTDNDLSIGTSGQVLTAGIGGQVIWGNSGSGGGDVYLAGGVSAQTPQTFTGYNKFDQIISGTLSGESTYAIALAGGAVGEICYQAASNDTVFLPVGTNGQILTLVSGKPAWASGGSGGGDVYLDGGTVEAPQTFTGFNEFSNPITVLTPFNVVYNSSQTALEIGFSNQNTATISTTSIVGLGGGTNLEFFVYSPSNVPTRCLYTTYSRISLFLATQFESQLIDMTNSGGSSGQVLTAGTGNQVIWSDPTVGGDVYLAGDNVYTGTNDFTDNGIICNVIQSGNTGDLQVNGTALGVVNGGLTSAILVGSANTNIFTSSTTPLINGTSCNISVQNNTGGTIDCFDFNAISNQSLLPFLFNSSIYDNNGDQGTAGQVLTAGAGSQVVWGAGGSGGGDVYLAGGTEGAPQIFTGYNQFNNSLNILNGNNYLEIVPGSNGYVGIISLSTIPQPSGSGIYFGSQAPNDDVFTVNMNMAYNTNQFLVPTQFQSQLEDNNGSGGTSGQVLTAGTGGQVVWGAGAGGGNVSTGTVNTFTESNVFNNNSGGGVELQCNVPAIFGQLATFDNAISVSTISSTTSLVTINDNLTVVGTNISLNNGGTSSVFQSSSNFTDIISYNNVPQANGTSIVLTVYSPSNVNTTSLIAYYNHLSVQVPIETTFSYPAITSQDFIGYNYTFYQANFLLGGGYAEIASFSFNATGIYSLSANMYTPITGSQATVALQFGTTLNINPWITGVTQSETAYLNVSATLYITAGTTYYLSGYGVYSNGNLVYGDNIYWTICRIA